MKEYCIYNVWNGGTPFIYNYKSFYEAKNALLEMISLEKERGRPYFVENDFYDNEYARGVVGKYFSIKVRDVSPWLTCLIETEEEKFSKLKNNKIIKIY